MAQQKEEEDESKIIQSVQGTAQLSFVTAELDKFDYDLIVIGGGSGGLACCQEAAKINPNLKIALFNYVKPSPQGTTWGIGGTCINVGCIPKKLMHYAATLRKSFDDAVEYGHEFSSAPTFQWSKLVAMVGDVSKGSHFWYENELRDLKITNINAHASFIDRHTVQYPLDGLNKKMTGKFIVTSYGCRPKLPDERVCVGARQWAITSDDLFSLTHPPGKTLIVGSSYVALECAGFLNDLGYDVTVMMRSDVLLRGFDQQMAKVVGELMEVGGVRFMSHCEPLSITKHSSTQKKIVHFQHNGKADKEEFDTVMFAIGREFLPAGNGLKEIGVQLSSETNKILTNENDQTNISSIFAIGDAAHGRSELTPVAIQAGRLLARRLFDSSSSSSHPHKMDYTIIPTTIFTPHEYGCVGMSEETARQQLGSDHVETYLSRFGITEITASWRKAPHANRSFVFHPKNEKDDDDFESLLAEPFGELALKKSLMVKLVVDISKNEQILGIHYIGPSAGEIIQGFTLAIMMKATKADFDRMVAIHPTAAEEFTNLKIKGSTCSSPNDYLKKGGCCG